MVNVDTFQVLVRSPPSYNLSMLIECPSVPLNSHGAATFRKIKKNDTLVTREAITVIFCADRWLLNFLALGEGV